MSAQFSVEIEEAESFQEYVLITALIPFETAPADFIENTLAVCNKINTWPFFKKDYFITNIKKPTPEQIMLFLRRLP